MFVTKIFKQDGFAAADVAEPLVDGFARGVTVATCDVSSGEACRREDAVISV
jgi:hypothetical protein